MSVFSVTINKKIRGKKRKVKVWRYDFELKKIRYQSQDFQTKAEAEAAKAEKKESLSKKQTDITFLELVEKWLDREKAYSVRKHYMNCVYLSAKWVQKWGYMNCEQITQTMIQEWVLERAQPSSKTGNKELKSLKACFNFGFKHRLISCDNPTADLDYLPTEKFIKYVPPIDDVIKVIWCATQEQRDYLFSIWDLKARMSEVNQLTWENVRLEDKTIILYTRKKKGGHLTPRKVAMTNRLYEIMLRRHKERDRHKPWVFVHTWYDMEGNLQEGPYKDRSKFMRTLCRKAGVKYFKFHALRHSGASVMASDPTVDIGSIQRILGHESHKTTQIYLHSIGESERRAMDRFEEITERKMGEGMEERKAKENKK